MSTRHWATAVAAFVSLTVSCSSTDVDLGGTLPPPLRRTAECVDARDDFARGATRSTRGDWADLTAAGLSTDESKLRIRLDFAEPLPSDGSVDGFFTVVLRDVSTGETASISLGSRPTSVIVDGDLGAPSAEFGMAQRAGSHYSTDVPISALPGFRTVEAIVATSARRSRRTGDNTDQLLETLTGGSLDVCPEVSAQDTAGVVLRRWPDGVVSAGFRLTLRPDSESITTAAPSPAASDPTTTSAVELNQSASDVTRYDQQAAALGLLDAWNAADPAAAALMASDDAVRFVFSEPTNRNAQLVRCRHFSEIADGEYPSFGTFVCDGVFDADWMSGQTMQIYVDGGASAGYKVTSVGFNENPPGWRPDD